MNVEKAFLQKLIKTEADLQKAIEKQVASEMILDSINRKLFDIISWYYNTYSSLLTADALKMILGKSKMDEELKQRVTLLYTEVASGTYENHPVTFLIDELQHAFKRDQLKKTLVNSVGLLEQSNVDAAINSLKDGVVKLELTGKDDVREGFIDESADSRMDRYFDIKNHPEKFRGIHIGWPTFDSVTNGVRGGQLMVIIGAVKEGKSTALLNIGYHAHANEGQNVLYVSVEMPKEQIERRYDARASQLSYSKIRDGRLNPQEEATYRKCLDKQKAMKNKFYVIDSHDCSTTYLRSKLQTFPHKFDLVVLDYLTLVQPSRRGRDQWEAIGKVTEEVRAIARELNIPIITAAQANREGIKESKYKYGVENIGLSHLISAHADTLLSLRLVDRDELEVSDIVEMTAATIAIRDDKGCRFTIDACFDKMLMTERQVDVIASGDPFAGVNQDAQLPSLPSQPSS